MNLATIEARTYARCGWDAANPGAAIVARIRGFINETYHQLLAKKGFESLRRQYVEFLSDPAIAVTALPRMVTRVFDVTDRSNGYLLTDITNRDIRRMDPQAMSSGVPQAYAIYNLNSPVFLQPSSPSQLYVVSSAAGDGATKSAYVQGMTHSGYPVAASVALNGITEVSVGTSIFALVTKFYIQFNSGIGLGAIATAAGSITLTEGSGGPTLGTIPIGRAMAHYSLLNFYPTPSSSLTYSADAELAVEELANPGDEPIFPEDFHGLLILGAVLKEYSRREKAPFMKTVKEEWNDLYGDLTVYANRSSTRQPTLGHRYGYSQLGPYFPAGS